MFKEDPYFHAKVGYLLRNLSILEQALAVSQGSADTCCPPVYVGDPNSISESKCTIAPEHVILLAEHQEKYIMSRQTEVTLS